MATTGRIGRYHWKDNLDPTGSPAEECNRPACPSQNRHWSSLPYPALAELHACALVSLTVTAAAAAAY